MSIEILENAIGPVAAKICAESTARNSDYLEKFQKIIERYIDENDVTFEVQNGTVEYCNYPVWGGIAWMNSNRELEITSLDNPEEMSKIQATLKAAIKKEVSEFGLYNLLAFGLNSPYLFYVLKEAKEFMTTEDFSVAMAIAASNKDFSGVFREVDGVAKDDVVEMLKSCDPKIFATNELVPRRSDDGEVIVFLEEQYTDEGEPDLSSVFAWFLWPENLIRYYLDIYGIEDLAGHGVYTAKIKTEDIFGINKHHEHNVILNPNGLHDIEYIDDVTKWIEYDEDEWRDKYGDDDEDNDEDDEE